MFFFKSVHFEIYNLILNVGANKISKYNLILIIKKVFNKDIKIVKFKDFKIDRPLNTKKFANLTLYKPKPWLVLIKELRSFMIKNNYHF